MNIKALKFVIISLFIFQCGILFSQNIDMDEVSAQEEFRWGVIAFHSGLYNKAIFSFEKSLSFKPDNTRTLEWLGYTYYISGFTDQALEIWSLLIDSGDASSLLKNRYNTVYSRLGLETELSAEQAENERWISIHEIKGSTEEYVLYSRPGSITPDKYGGFYLAAFASNEVLYFNANGALRRKIMGGLEGLDHPFDVLLSKTGNLFISEYEGDRIVRCSPEGGDIFRFGSKGRGDGQFLGPQYITEDDNGYIYVTDQGNRRISKYDYDGNFVLSFGGKSVGFNGFRSPSGIVYHNGIIYAADSIHSEIYAFDISGNYLASFGKGVLESPEGLSVYSDGVLLVADTRRVMMFELENILFTTLSEFDGEASRIMKSVLDANSNLLSVDFDQNQVFQMTGLSSIYSGLSVKINSIKAETFPVVFLDITIAQRNGDPFIGLDSNNFLITEGKKAVIEPEMVFIEKHSDTDIVLLIDKTEGMSLLREQIGNAAEQIALSIQNEGVIQVVNAGVNPVLSGPEGLSVSEIIAAATDPDGFSEKTQFDMGLRLAVSQLIPGRNKRAVVFITDGKIGTDPFESYELNNLLYYMQNNSIIFYTVYIQSSDRSGQEELEYLCRESGGKSYFLNNSLNLSEIAKDLQDKKSGNYMIKYTSASETDFGNAFIPVEAEIFLFNRTGRDESGYYAPLEF